MSQALWEGNGAWRVAFTGHRPEKLGGYADDNPVRLRIKAALTTALEVLQLERGGELAAITGMALGVDPWAAKGDRRHALSISWTREREVNAGVHASGCMRNCSDGRWRRSPGSPSSATFVTPDAYPHYTRESNL